jgi:LIM domain
MFPVSQVLQLSYSSMCFSCLPNLTILIFLNNVLLKLITGMCAKCGRSIMGENAGCSALDQLFHVDCFRCETCSKCTVVTVWCCINEIWYPYYPSICCSFCIQVLQMLMGTDAKNFLLFSHNYKESTSGFLNLTFFAHISSWVPF